jgi:hypothetical protein
MVGGHPRGWTMRKLASKLLLDWAMQCSSLRPYKRPWMQWQSIAIGGNDDLVNKVTEFLVILCCWRSYGFKPHANVNIHNVELVSVKLMAGATPWGLVSHVTWSLQMSWGASMLRIKRGAPYLILWFSQTSQACSTYCWMLCCSQDRVLLSAGISTITCKDWGYLRLMSATNSHDL